MNNKEQYFCRVCGLEQTILPWGEDGKTPTFDICDCCGVEFGYEDNNPESTKKYRKEWLEKGAKWFKENHKPKFWDLKKQLFHIPKGFL